MTEYFSCIPYRQYRSGTWNTIKFFLEKGGNIGNVLIYNEYETKWVFEELPMWIQNKTLLRIIWKKKY